MKSYYSSEFPYNKYPDEEGEVSIVLPLVYIELGPLLSFQILRRNLVPM